MVALIVICGIIDNNAIVIIIIIKKLSLIGNTTELFVFCTADTIYMSLSMFTALLCIF